MTGRKPYLMLMILLCCLFIGGLSVSVSAEEALQALTEAPVVIEQGICGDAVTWVLYDNGELVVQGSGAMTKWEPSIRDQNVKTVTITNGVTSIGRSMFSGMETVQYVTLPESMISIGEYAFYSCKYLTYVTIPNGIVSIGELAFQDCVSLQSIKIPDSVTELGTGAFAGCYCLYRAVIGNEITVIEPKTFRDCPHLVSVTLGDRISRIAESAFSNCNELQSITLPDSVTSIEDFAFYYCWSLQEITIPGKVTTIGRCAFNGCNALDEVTIPNGVVSIGEEVFSSCDGLERIILPDSLTTIGPSAFWNDTRLVSIKVAESNSAYSAQNGVLFDKDKTTLIAFPAGKSGSYTIPDSVVKVEQYAFSRAAFLHSVVIPDSVTSLGKGAFLDCTGLCKVMIPDSVTSIDESAFSGCTGLCSVTLPNAKMGKYVFWNCPSLRSVVIPNGMTSIQDYTFLSCKNLSSVTLPHSLLHIGQWAFGYDIDRLDIYYNGTKSEWESLIIENGNLALDEALIHCIVFSPQYVQANGRKQKLSVYNINGTDYGRLRDIAAMLKGTSAQFDVSYDEEHQTVVIRTGQCYEGEIDEEFQDNADFAVVSPQRIQIDGNEAEWTAYNIKGNNFVSLNALKEALHF